MFDTLLLLGIFISLLAGQFARIELINALANVYIHEFLLFIFIIKSLIKNGITPITRMVKSRTVLFLFVLFGGSFIFSINEFTVLQNGISFLYILRIMLYVVFGIYLFATMKRDKNMRVILFTFIYSFSILLLIITAIQYIFFPNFWGLYAFGWDPHLYRASGIYLDVFIAAALYGLLALFWYIKKHMVLSLFFVIALILSFSRSAYIAFVVSIIYLFITQKKGKELFISLSLFALCVILIPKPFGEGGNLMRTSSIKSRMLDYTLGLTLWQKKPILGFGYNRIRFAKEHHMLIAQDDRSHSLASFHSSFLIILVTTGIVGLLSSIYLLGKLFVKYPQLRVYFVYILTMSLFDNVLLHALVLLPFIFLATHITQSSLE